MRVQNNLKWPVIFEESEPIFISPRVLKRDERSMIGYPIKKTVSIFSNPCQITLSHLLP